MKNLCLFSDNINSVPIVPICHDLFPYWLNNQSEIINYQIKINKFSAKPGSYLLLFDENGNFSKVLLGLNNIYDYHSFGVLPAVLPNGYYDIYMNDLSVAQYELAIIGWGLGCYQFNVYNSTAVIEPVLLCRCQEDRLRHIKSQLNAHYSIKDMINTPAVDMYPEKLADIALSIAKEHKADIDIIQGEKLCTDFPAVYAVGRGSNKKPLLIDMRHGSFNDPKIVIIGKGVCFDSGGLQLKNSSGMLCMKRDMAGAAHALALARMIMEHDLSINLRVIIPAVENLISGNSYKPGDIIKTRNKITVEIANTDAEGRVILADALALASEWAPDLILDFATLTHAAFVALGSDITAYFTNDDLLSENLLSYFHQEQENVWRMPLFKPYAAFLKSDFANIRNISNSEFAGGGAISAALFLEKFVKKNIKWIHFDINAYNMITRPGRPTGAETCCIMGIFRYLESQYSKKS